MIIIDEAYSIVEENGTMDSFGNEAIAQLIIELEIIRLTNLSYLLDMEGMLTKKITECRHFLILIQA